MTKEDLAAVIRIDERNKTIEECAKVAESAWARPRWADDYYKLADEIATAIRALKDKP